MARGPAEGARLLLEGPIVGDRHLVHYWLGLHEVAVQKALMKMVSRGSTVYDVGAYCGFFSLICGRFVGSGGRVFAFEPVPQNVAQLRLHAELNGMSWVIAVPKAVADISGLVAWDPGQRGDWGRLAARSEGEMVEAISLDDFVFSEGNAPPDLMKIDVEGAEARVVRGAERILRKWRPVVICEIHGETVGSVVIEELRAVGYKIYNLDRMPIGNPPNYGHVLALPDPT